MILNDISVGYPLSFFLYKLVFPAFYQPSKTNYDEHYCYEVRYNKYQVCFFSQRMYHISLFDEFSFTVAFSNV